MQLQSESIRRLAVETLRAKAREDLQRAERLRALAEERRQALGGGLAIREQADQLEMQALQVGWLADQVEQPPVEKDGPRAARDVPPGTPWFFLDHRTVAEVWGIAGTEPAAAGGQSK